MLSVLWQVSSVLLGAGLLLVGSSLLSILLPLSMQRAGFPTELTGLVMSSYYAGLMLGSKYGLAVITRLGHIRAFAGFAAIVCASVLAHPLWIDVAPWIALRLVCGFCLAGLFAVMESWLNDSSTNQTRGRVLSIYLMTNYIAMTAGQLLVNVWEFWRLEPYMVGGLIVALSLVPVVMTRERAPDISRVEPLRLRELFRVSPLSVVGTFSSGLLMGGFYGMGAVYGQLVQFDVLGISIFLSALVVGGFLLQFPIGKLSDVLDRRSVMAVAVAVAGGLSVLGIFLPGLTRELWLFALLAALCGGPFSVVYPLSTGQAFDYLPKERYVAASGGLLLSYAIGATLGPLACSFVMARLGAPAFFGYFAVVCGALLLFTLYRMRMRTPLPARQQEVFKNVPALSPVAAELDPRAVHRGDAPKAAT
jgi:MFS family permease